MLERTSNAQWAKSAFFEQYQDIDIYVEDDSRETRKLYATLLSKALAGSVRLDRVFPLGPRAAVLDACARDQEAGGRLRVYIVDADLGLCQGAEHSALRRLYRLPRYCIENFLIDEGAGAAVLARESEDSDAAMMAQRLRFNDWLVENAVPLRRLFLAYAAANRICPSVPTISVGYTRIIADDSGQVDPLRVEDVIHSIAEGVDSLCGAGAFQAEYRAVERENVHKGDIEFSLHCVSGKDYLLPLFRLRMNRVVRINRSMALLKIHLAEAVGDNELKDILAVAC